MWTQGTPGTQGMASGGMRSPVQWDCSLWRRFVAGKMVRLCLLAAWVSHLPPCAGRPPRRHDPDAGRRRRLLVDRLLHIKVQLCRLRWMQGLVARRVRRRRRRCVLQAGSCRNIRLTACKAQGQVPVQTAYQVWQMEKRDVTLMGDKLLLSRRCPTHLCRVGKAAGCPAVQRRRHARRSGRRCARHCPSPQTTDRRQIRRPHPAVIEAAHLGIIDTGSRASSVRCTARQLARTSLWAGMCSGTYRIAGAARGQGGCRVRRWRGSLRLCEVGQLPLHERCHHLDLAVAGVGWQGALDGANAAFTLLSERCRCTGRPRLSKWANCRARGLPVFEARSSIVPPLLSPPTPHPALSDRNLAGRLRKMRTCSDGRCLRRGQLRRCHQPGHVHRQPACQCVCQVAQDRRLLNRARSHASEFFCSSSNTFAGGIGAECTITGSSRPDAHEAIAW